MWSPSGEEEVMVIAKIWIGRKIRYFIAKIADTYMICTGKPSDGAAKGVCCPSLERALDELDMMILSSYGFDGIENYRLERVY